MRKLNLFLNIKYMRNTLAALGASMTLALSSGCSTVQNKTNQQTLDQIAGFNGTSTLLVPADMNELDFEIKTGISSSFLWDGVYTALNSIQQNIITAAFRAGADSTVIWLPNDETVHTQSLMAEEYATKYTSWDPLLHRLVVVTFLKAIQEHGRKPTGTISIIEELKFFEPYSVSEKEKYPQTPVLDIQKKSKKTIKKDNK